jgi:hypothetical protein
MWRRTMRSREFRPGMGGAGEPFGESADEPFSRHPTSLWVPFSLVHQTMLGVPRVASRNASFRSGSPREIPGR